MRCAEPDPHLRLRRGGRLLARCGGGRRPPRPRNAARQVDDLEQEVESSKRTSRTCANRWRIDLFDECVFTIGVSPFGAWGGDVGFLFGPGGRQRRPALAIDMRGFGRARYRLLCLPGEKPPSIECNEDASEEFIDN